VFETINRAAVEASSDIAKQKGSYKYFEGSDWQTGEYFTKRGYTSPEWTALAAKVKEQGMRNAYLLAIAPTSRMDSACCRCSSASYRPSTKPKLIHHQRLFNASIARTLLTCMAKWGENHLLCAKQIA